MENYRCMMDGFERAEESTNRSEKLNLIPVYPARPRFLRVNYEAVQCIQKG